MPSPPPNGFPVPPPQPTKTPVSKGKLAALIGAAAALLLAPMVQKYEGRRNVPYKDIVGIWTVCDGDTKNVTPGQRQTNAECDARLEQQLIAHAKPVMDCVPVLANHPNQLAASVSLAYNIGPSGFCRSTVAKRFNQRQWAAACDAFLAWNKAGGRAVDGLTRRRQGERAVCLRELPANGST